MKTIRNTTHRPLRVPLPQGKVLHLGPLKEGQVADHLDHPPLKKMIDAGEIEVVDTGKGGAASGHGGGGAVHDATHGHVPTKVVHPSGDR
jgi:hypothetical protein